MHSEARRVCFRTPALLGLDLLGFLAFQQFTDKPQTSHGMPLDPVEEGVMAQFPAGRPAQATTGGESPPVAEIACEDHYWERVFHASVRPTSAFLGC